MFANILIAGGALWIFLSILSYMQFVQLRGIYNVLSEKGRIVTGQNRGLLSPKYRLFAAVSKEGVVMDVRVLKTVHFVTPPKVLECPQLIGSDLDTLDSAALEAAPRILKAAEDLKVSWARLKPTLNRTVPSIAPKPGAKQASWTDDGGEEESHNTHLARGEREIRSLLMNDELNINREPLAMVLDALRDCDSAYTFSTDEVIADKAVQLRLAITGKGIDVPKVDGLIETMFRLIAQREREAQFRRG